MPGSTTTVAQQHAPSPGHIRRTAARLALLTAALAAAGTALSPQARAASTTTVAVGQQPVAIAVNAATNKIYVANNRDNTVTVINGATNATATVAVGQQPDAIAVNAATNLVYVANSSANTDTVLSPSTPRCPPSHDH